MRALLHMEKRLQDIETRMANHHRFGEVTDVKFDEQRKRWYVKMQDGQDEGLTFKSDWLPWQSFAHETIAVSMPPRKKQKVAYHAPGGYPEMAYIKPFHNDPDNVSPNGKLDEIHQVIQAPKSTNSGSGSSSGGSSGDKYEHWTHQTADTHHTVVVKQQDTSHAAAISPSTSGLTGSSGTANRERKMPDVSDDGAEHTVQSKTNKDGHNVTVNKSSRIQATDQMSRMTAGEDKHSVTAHKESGLKLDTAADVVTNAAQKIASSAQNIMHSAMQNIVSSANALNVAQAAQKVVLQGGSGGGGAGGLGSIASAMTTMMDQPIINQLKGLAQQALQAAEAEVKSITKSTKLPSGATYNYTVSRA